MKYKNLTFDIISNEFFIYYFCKSVVMINVHLHSPSFSCVLLYVSGLHMLVLFNVYTYTLTGIPLRGNKIKTKLQTRESCPLTCMDGHENKNKVININLYFSHLELQHPINKYLPIDIILFISISKDSYPSYINISLFISIHWYLELLASMSSLLLMTNEFK